MFVQVEGAPDRGPRSPDDDEEGRVDDEVDADASSAVDGVLPHAMTRGHVRGHSDTMTPQVDISS